MREKLQGSHSHACGTRSLEGLAPTIPLQLYTSHSKHRTAAALHCLVMTQRASSWFFHSTAPPSLWLALASQAATCVRQSMLRLSQKRLSFGAKVCLVLASCQSHKGRERAGVYLCRVNSMPLEQCAGCLAMEVEDRRVDATLNVVHRTLAAPHTLVSRAWPTQRPLSLLRDPHQLTQATTESATLCAQPQGPLFVGH